MTSLCAFLSIKKAKDFSLHCLKNKELNGKEETEKEIEACQMLF